MGSDGFVIYTNTEDNLRGAIDKARSKANTASELVSECENKPEYTTGGAFNIAYPHASNDFHLTFNYNYTHTKWESSQRRCITSNLLGYWDGIAEEFDNAIAGRSTDRICNSPDSKPATCPKAGSNTASGDPIDMRTGAVFHDEFDLQLASGLVFSRHYNSHDSMYAIDGSHRPVINYMLGNWRADFLANSAAGNVDYQIGASNLGFRFITALARRPDGSAITFSAQQQQQSGIWTFVSPWSSTTSSLEMKTRLDASGQWIGVELGRGDGVVEVYDMGGYLTAIQDGFGTLVSVERDSVIPAKVNAVVDRFGNRLGFDYSSINGVMVLTKLWLNGAEWATYGYTPMGYLSSVTYQDGRSRQYLYENPAYPMAVTRIRDESDRDVIRWAYDPERRAISSYRGDGKMQVNLRYLADLTYKKGGGDWFWVDRWLHEPAPRPKEDLPQWDAVEETFPNGLRNTYRMTFTGGELRTTSKARVADYSTGINATYLTSYDDRGNITSTQDWRGASSTSFEYDARDLQTKRTESSPGTSEVHVTTTEWHATLRKPTRITTANLETSLTYDRGLVAKVTENDKSIWVRGIREWNYTYNGGGQLETIDGPLSNSSGTPDITRYTYTVRNDNTGVIGGRLESVINPLGQKTTITGYNTLGYPTTMVDANGITTQLGYDLRSRLISVTVADPAAGNLQTTFTRDSAGRITRITRPDDSYLDYEYDEAGWVVGITDNTNARVEYDRDNEGNVTEIRVRHGNTTAIVRRATQTFDALSRLTSIVNGPRMFGSLMYDENGNITWSADGLGNGTIFMLDSFDRVSDVVYPPGGGSISLGYEDQENLTVVIDSRQLRTYYSYDGFGCLREQTSPDTGRTEYTCDLAGNVVSKKDARNVTATYVYDVLGRLTSTSYSGGSSGETATFTYDQTAAGVKDVGRLTSAVNGSAVITWKHDARGNVIEDRRKIGNIDYVTSYLYDKADRIKQITYPSGRTVDYTRNAAGQVTGVTTNSTAMGTKTVANNIIWAPFGGLEALTYGNGLSESRLYDSDGFMTSLAVGNVVLRNYEYDGAGRITRISDLDPTATETYAYSPVDRLTGATGPYGSHTYTYDGVGNRTKLIKDSVETNYTYAGDSNRLTKVGNGNLVWDAAGNLLSRGNKIYTYNAANRLASVMVGTTNYSFGYSALGERVIKQTPTATTHFHYDQFGHLLAETDSTGALIREYIWLDDKPLGLVSKSNTGTVFNLYYVHSDHLDSALMITNSAKGSVWKYSREPFGNLAAGGNTVKWFLRFPGQYADTETGTFYNYFRDYDPATGRYIESDPIGLAGGINTYAYALGNPLSNVDPTGEVVPLVAMGVGALIGGGIDLVSQLVDNGGNLDCVEWSEVFFAGASSMSVGGRFGYKAVLAWHKRASQNMSRREAYELRKRIKNDFRMVKPVRDFLSRRDDPFEKVRDPLDSFSRTSRKWDVGLTSPGAVAVGATVGSSDSGGGCGCK